MNDDERVGLIINDKNEVTGIVRPRVCGDCNHWYRTGDEAFGECRGAPPQVVIENYMNEDGVLQTDKYTEYREVESDFPSCKEWKNREG